MSVQDKHWSSIPEKGSVLGLRILFWIYQFLGRRVIHLVMHPIALYYTLFNSEVYKSSLNYLENLSRFAKTQNQNTPSPTWMSVYKHIHAFAVALVDKLGAWTEDPNLTPVHVSTESIRKILSQNKGAVLLSGHIGNIEVMRAVADKMGNVVVNALMFTNHAQKFNRLLSEVNPNSHLKIIPLEEITVGTVLELERCINRGECVALLADRVSASSPGRVVSVSFLGKQANFPEGPFILANLLGCPVFFCSALLSPEGYKIEVSDFADKISLPRKNRREAIQNYAQLFSKKLEDACLRAPYQWFNFYSFWGK